MSVLWEIDEQCFDMYFSSCAVRSQLQQPGEGFLTQSRDATKGCLGMGQRAGKSWPASRTQATGSSAKTHSLSGVRELANVGLSSTAVFL